MTEEDVDCRWCRGTGTISGDHPTYECTDCGGRGYLRLCGECGEEFPLEELDESDLCADCWEMEQEDGET